MSDVRTRFENEGADAVSSTPQELRTLITTDIERNTEHRDEEEAREPVEYPEGEIPLTDGKPGAPEQVALMHRAVDELRAGRAAERALKVGDRAPDFTLPNADERLVSARELLARGPLVVTFYRGRW